MAIKYAKATSPNLTGTSSADWLWGHDGDNVIKGEGGSDNIYGGYGVDSLYGGAGNDIIRAGAGDDRVAGGAGSDILTGDTGNDTFIFRAADGGGTDLIRDFGKGGDVLLLQEGLNWTSSVADVDGDGDSDTVVTLSNSGVIVLQDYTGALGPANVVSAPLTGNDLLA